MSLRDRFSFSGRVPGAPSAEEFAAQRAEMVEKQIRRRGISSARVLEAMLGVPRHEFIPAAFLTEAYADKPLPIGEAQTISQPYIVAAMTAALTLTGTERVLEIGAGCGYQAAVLSRLAADVYTIESRLPLALAARERLERLGYTNVHVHAGDGTLGLPECAPFDAILVTAAAPAPPAPLLEQLAEGGRLVIPVGPSDYQELLLIHKSAGETRKRVLEECRFVPLVGRHGWREPFLE
ncbi:MAG TPA: protein-L-isoaspartate(D-aspartate) O-methyltransferase [Candidatus Acidoferrales bacterium]|nr:protein-L-isoaspartate(D-aspartate) O-methyltransferase [Candidatus Acidoferrales bacterium]